MNCFNQYLLFIQIPISEKMPDKFDNLPKDPDTATLSSETLIIDGVDVKLESWYWDGIWGKSAIFLAEQVIKLSDEEIIDKISPVIEVTEPFTTSRKSNGYVFINFDFEEKDFWDFDIDLDALRSSLIEKGLLKD